MRRFILPGAAIVIAAIVAVVIAVIYFRHHGSGTAKGTPPAAIAAVRQLTTGTSATDQRAAVAPALAAELPPGQPFPAGTSFTPLAGSWAQSGNYAHLTGTLREAGAAPVQVEIGLMLSGGRWLVTFEEPT